METSRIRKRREFKRRKNVIKMFGLFCFIILVVIYSYFLLQSKFQLEANASPPIEVDDTIEESNDNSNIVPQDEPKQPDDQSDVKEPATDTTKEETNQEETPDETPTTEQEKPTTETTKPPTTSDSKTVYLTFDDGPHKVSKDILALLAEYDAKATFFMLDGNIKMYPDAVKQMVEQGHSVGMHGVTHDKNKYYKSKNSVVQEMDKARQTILDITGYDSTLIRTPFGSSPYMTDAYKAAVDAAGYKMWDWNIDSRDWSFRDGRYVDSVIAQLLKLEEKNTEDPIVILMHERPETLKELPRLLDYLQNRGYSFDVLDPSMEPIHLR